MGVCLGLAFICCRQKGLTTEVTENTEGFDLEPFRLTQAGSEIAIRIAFEILPAVVSIL